MKTAHGTLPSLAVAGTRRFQLPPRRDWVRNRGAMRDNDNTTSPGLANAGAEPALSAQAPAPRAARDSRVRRRYPRPLCLAVPRISSHPTIALEDETTSRILQRIFELTPQAETAIFKHERPAEEPAAASCVPVPPTRCRSGIAGGSAIRSTGRSCSRGERRYRKSRSRASLLSGRRMTGHLEKWGR